jgi:alkylhydroperoxidase family enzyme
VLEDYRTAPIAEGLRATLAFLERVTLAHGEVTPGDAKAALAAGVTREALVDALNVLFLFNVYDRLADTLGWEISKPEEYRRMGKMLLKRGYG